VKRVRATIRKRRWWPLAVLIIAVPGLIWAYPRFALAPLWYDVVGVDVSNHQGDIDWPALAASGIAFAYIKATEGGDFRDQRFRQNWDAARNAGVPRGAYHFFRQCRTGADQASNFIATVPRERDALPPVVDVEHMGPCTGPQPSDVAQEIVDLLRLLEAHYGRRPLLYATAEFEAAYLRGGFTGEVFWARSMFWPPQFRTDQWRLWQYHDRGSRPGIAGPVDLDAFRGTKSDFQAFVAGPAGP
jgi:lysozyme